MSSPSNTLRSLKQFVPAPVKRAAREMQSHWRLGRAIDRIASLPLGQVPSPEHLLDLQSGWANEGFAAKLDFLTEVARIATTTTGPILECGSGMTTILLGLLAGRRGINTYSLEHIAEWRERVVDTLAEFSIPGVEVLLTQLRDFDGFAWYDAPLNDLPREFQFVICDGPPGDTLGGRYGLMTVMGDHFPAGSIILLDDTERPGELEVLRRWQRETKVEVSTRETPEGSFAVITRQPTMATKSTKNQAPLVSVIIPAFKVASFIGKTLDSVLAQTFADFEVIVVNDGSPDTEEFERAIEPFRDRIYYLKQENQGASVARNTGLQAARGEFVAFLDADDLWLPDYLQEQLRFINERGCDLVCADAILFGNGATENQTYMEELMDAAPSEGEVTFLQLLNTERHIITSGVVVRRQPIMDVGLFDKNLRNSQDFDLWLRLARHGARLAYQKKALLKYRQRTDGLTGDEVNCHKRELRIYEKIERSYGFTPSEREQFLPVIRERRALLEFELGKVYLARGQFKQACESFAQANQEQKTAKRHAVLWMTRLFPGVMQKLCLRRM